MNKAASSLGWREREFEGRGWQLGRGIVKHVYFYLFKQELPNCYALACLCRVVVLLVATGHENVG